MSRNLALTLIGPRRGKNTATHGDSIKIEFTNPPREANDVEILIRDLTHVDRGSRHVASTDVFRVRGQIREGKFAYQGHTALEELDRHHRKPHEMQVTFVVPGGGHSIVTRLPDLAKKDHMVISHRLKWFCRAAVGASWCACRGRRRPSRTPTTRRCWALWSMRRSTQSTASWRWRSATATVEP